MIKYSLFGWIKSFFKFSTICLSNLFGYFCKVAYPKIWWSHWHRQVQREIRDKIEEYKKSGTEKKGKKGGTYSGMSLVGRWIARGKRKTTDFSSLAIHHHVLFTRLLKRLPVGLFIAIVPQHARKYSLDLRYFQIRDTEQ